MMSHLAPEMGRYVLYGAITCPFTHRVTLVRAWHGLQGWLPLVYARPVPGAQGWAFDQTGGDYADRYNSLSTLGELYRLSDPDYAGRGSVPVLWDAERRCIVSSESTAIAHMLNNCSAATGPDLYPAAERARIDADIAEFDAGFVMQIIRAGAAEDQAGYDAAVSAVFAWLDRLDACLAHQRYLGKATPDFADLVILTALVRFDSCYYFGSRCHLRRIQDYPAVWGYTRELCQLPGVAETIDLAAFRRSYYATRAAGRQGVTPIGPDIDFFAPHGRDSVPTRRS
jgi:putative glutathione S-transferase